MPIQRFLIIDRLPKHTSFFNEVLADLEYQAVFTTSTTDEGMEMLTKKKAQFMIVSLDAAPTPGTVFVQRVRHKPEFRYLPIVTYSEKVSDNDIHLLSELGLDSVIRPPFEKQQVTDFLKRLIEAEDNLDQVEKSLRKMETLLERGRTSEAIQLLTPKLTKPGPHFLRAHTLVGEVYLAIDKVQRAREFLNKAMAKNPDYAPCRYLESKVLAAEGNHDKSVAILEEMVGLAPQNLTSLVNLGSAYIDADRIEEAKTTMAQASDIDPENEQVKEQNGKIAFMEGDMKRAKTLLSATGNGIRLARFFNDAAIRFVKANEFNKGMETYEKAMELIQDDALHCKLTYNKGLCAEKNGSTIDAFKYYATAYMKDPKFETAYSRLAKAFKAVKAAGQSEQITDLVKQVKDIRAANPKSEDENAA